MKKLSIGITTGEIPDVFFAGVILNQFAKKRGGKNSVICKKLTCLINCTDY